MSKTIWINTHSPNLLNNCDSKHFRQIDCGLTTIVSCGLLALHTVYAAPCSVVHCGVLHALRMLHLFHVVFRAAGLWWLKCLCHLIHIAVVPCYCHDHWKMETFQSKLHIQMWWLCTTCLVGQFSVIFQLLHSFCLISHLVMCSLGIHIVVRIDLLLPATLQSCFYPTFSRQLIK